MKTFGRICQLTKRNILLFLKNKTTILFSFMAPVLIFVLYTLFMDGVLISSVSEVVPKGAEIDADAFKSLTAAWMIAGIISIACLTIGLNFALIMVQDKENKTINDFIASPFSPALLMLSYFLAAFVLTFTLCFAVMSLGFFYLSIFTKLIFGILEFLHMTAILFFACLSAVTFMLTIMSFFKTNSSSAPFTGIFSAIVGFLTGAYLPAGMLPKGVQNFANIMPGSHATALFRNVLLSKSYSEISGKLEAETMRELSKFFSFDLELFGVSISSDYMYLYLFFSAILFGGLFLIINLFMRKSKVRN